MPIVPTVVGGRSPSVVPTVVGWRGSLVTLLEAVGFLHADVTLQAALEGDLSVHRQILTALVGVYPTLEGNLATLAVLLGDAIVRANLEGITLTQALLDAEVTLSESASARISTIGVVHADVMAGEALFAEGLSLDPVLDGAVRTYTTLSADTVIRR